MPQNPLVIQTPRGPITVAPDQLSPQTMQYAQSMQPPDPVFNMAFPQASQSIQPPQATPVSMPMAQPVSSPGFAPMPAYTTESQITSTVATPEQKKLVKEEQKLLQNYGKQMELANQQTQEALNAQSLELNKQAEQTAKETADFNAKQQWQQKELELVHKEWQDSQPGEFKYKSFWQDKSSFDKIGAALAMALGAVGGALSGTNRNDALQIIENNIDRDMAMQRDAYQSKKGVFDQKGQLYSNAVRKFGDEQLAFLQMQDAKYKGVQLRLQAMASQAQSAEQQQKFLALMSDLSNKRAQLGQEAAGRMQVVQQVKQNQPIAQLKETEAKAAGFADQMEQAESTLVNLQKEGYDPTSTKRRVEGLLPNEARSSEFQRQEQAETAFVTAVLRNESGGAITPDEVVAYRSQYFPRPGDSKDVVKQKEADRRQAIQKVRLGAGQYGAQMMQRSKGPDYGSKYGLTPAKD